MQLTAIGSRLLLAAVLAAATAGAAGAAGEEGAFEFALIGDTPYGVAAGEAYPPFERLMREINGEAGVEWVLHAGDIKGEGTDCSEAIYKDRRARLDRLEAAVVVTPGDNDWTDCHRSGSGDWDPLKRLAVFRQVFYPEPGRSIGGEPMDLASQAQGDKHPGFPEHVRWEHRGVVFAAAHLVGSRNARNEFPGRDSDDEAEVEARTAAALAWLKATFAQAERSGARGVFFMIHANPLRGHFNQPGEIDAAYMPFMQALERLARRFGEPVVLAHGDSHYYRVDKPYLPRERDSGELAASRLDNFTRVESFGAPLTHWVRVRVDPADPELFSFRQEIVADG